MANQAGINDSSNIPLIVGIGASAGGLSAISELLQCLPADTGMAFVLVQYLDPTQERLLHKLLTQATPMPIIPVTDGNVVEANHVYAIPPNTQVTIAQGRLTLTPCDQGQGSVKTIDLFLQSLAADCQGKAIAVILSGSDDDGAMGIQAIRATGGITFAQSRATAECADMPGAAMATGQVDFILSPAEMAAELVKISHQPYLCEPVPVEEPPSPSVFEENDLLAVFRLLQKQTGVDFASYKPTTFERRLRRRMVLHKLASLAEYIQYLQSNPPEIQALYQDVLITVTSFFRDSGVYEVLKTQVFPTILQQQSAAASIRIWVPGCATGEEAYSIAICLLEVLDALVTSPTIQVFGTDINELAIEEARLGFYRDNRMEGLSPERRRRFFVELDGGWQINKSVRELCIFARQDLGSDPPFSDIDLVSCRNVLIYFKPNLQKRALSVFHYSLKRAGFLILGNAESVGDTSDLFGLFDAPAKIYTRQAVPTRLNFDFVTNHYPQEFELQRHQGFSASLSRSNVQQWADQIVLNRYGPVGVIVNESLDILQFRGETSPYLRPPLGKPSFNLLKMIRPNLLSTVRTVIQQVKEQRLAVKRQQLKVEGLPAEEVALEVIPFTASTSQERCFLVLFERDPRERAKTTGALLPETRRELANPGPEMKRLRQELAATRQELLDTQTFLNLTIEEAEATNQQLLAANEEILSSNEELKSTNEELQTAKEEIQSANEELKTTNEELHSRNVEARRAHDDLVNLINNANIPILMLAQDLSIRSFTPSAQGIFNLIPSDIGRPISDIRLDIDVPDLETLILGVIETLDTVEREVQDSTGCWYFLRIRPYCTIDNRIDGAVIALVEIDTLKQTEQELRISQGQLAAELFAMSQLQTLSLQLFSSLELSQALYQVLEAALAIHQAEIGYVQLYVPQRDVLEIVAHIGLKQDFLEAFSTVSRREESPYDRVLTQGQRVIISDLQSDSEFEAHYPMVAATGCQAGQSTPLINRNGTLLGVLAICFRQPHVPPDRELRMLDLYARQVSEFIDLIQAERERQRLLEREQAANASKDQFLSVLSHELRTPLNMVMGWVQVLEQGGLTESRLQQAIAAIKKGADAQLKLIDDLLDTSRIIQDRFQISPQPTNLTDLLRQTILAVQPQMTQKDICCEEYLENAPDRMMVDPTRMVQIFCNVLSNAVKFTPRGGSITVRLTYTSAQIQVQVSDTGKGISPELLPHIFERFRQADTSNTRREGGLGLGLFLVHALVAAHGGTIQAESAGVGQGATFTIILPRVVATASQPQRLPPALTETTLTGIRLLLVEDDESSLLALTLRLEHCGASVFTASSAAEALAIVTTQSLDVLICDIGLPDVNGYEFLQQVRSLPVIQASSLPAIALTGYVSEEDIRIATAAGFQRHIAKPCAIGHLVNIILSLVRA